MFRRYTADWRNKQHKAIEYGCKLLRVRACVCVCVRESACGAGRMEKGSERDGKRRLESLARLEQRKLFFVRVRVNLYPIFTESRVLCGFYVRWKSNFLRIFNVFFSLETNGPSWTRIAFIVLGVLWPSEWLVILDFLMDSLPFAEYLRASITFSRDFLKLLGFFNNALNFSSAWKLSSFVFFSMFLRRFQAFSSFCLFQASALFKFQPIFLVPVYFPQFRLFFPA